MHTSKDNITFFKCSIQLLRYSYLLKGTMKPQDIEIKICLKFYQLTIACYSNQSSFVIDSSIRKRNLRRLSLLILIASFDLRSHKLFHLLHVKGDKKTFPTIVQLLNLGQGIVPKVFKDDVGANSSPEKNSYSYDIPGCKGLINLLIIDSASILKHHL